MTTDTSSILSPTSQASTDNAPMLRSAFRANAALSLLSGLLFIADAKPIAAFLGIDKTLFFGDLPGASLMLVLGVLILVFAGWVFFVSTRRPLPRRPTVAILIGDTLWVLGSIALIVSGDLPLTTAGTWAIMIAADLVLALAIWEFVGIRRMSAG